MKKILGLDISTSMIGCCFINGEDNNLQNIEIEFIDVNKIIKDFSKDFYGPIQKFEKVKSYINNIIEKYNPDEVYIESPNTAFKARRSTVDTIIKLVQFNYLVSYFIWKKLDKKPIHIVARSARKKVFGKDITKKVTGGMDIKHFIFELLRNKIEYLDKYNWPTKKNGTLQKHCYDMTDAVVVALAGLK